MELDYDIYSYLVRGIGEGTLIPQFFREKVNYEIVDIEPVNLNKRKSENIRFKLKIVNKNGKRITDEAGKNIFYYETDEELKKNYIRVFGKKNILKKKQEVFTLIHVPKSVKIPLNKDINRLYVLEKGKWIDISKIDDIKFYSNKKFNLLFEQE